jgi:hypothetical protein
MAGLNTPNDFRVAPGGPVFGEVWRKFFAAVGRKFAAGSNVATVTTADASDLATAIALANALKTKVNELIAAQKA